MAQTVLAKPVAIRLAQRYPNGCMLTYSARAIAHGKTFVRVVVNQEFETGIQLSVMAPFLEGMTVGRVYSTKRSENQPGFFEVILRIGEDAVSAVLVNAEVEAGGGGPDTERRSQVPALAVEAAEKLADELERRRPRTIAHALDRMPSHLRPMALLVTVATAIHLLQQKGFVVARRLLDNTRDSASRRAPGAKEVSKQ